MNEFSGPGLQKGQSTRNSANGLNLDGVAALFVNAVAVTGGLQLNTLYTLLSIADAKALKLSTAYDVANDCIVYEHIYRFFACNPTGKLYLLPFAKTATLTDMVPSIRPIMINPATKQEIKMIGLAYNPEFGTVLAYTNGYLTATLTAANAAQAVVNDLVAEGYYLPAVLIEGRMNPLITISTSQDWRDEDGPNVSIISFQDPAISVRGGFAANYGDVGSALGMLSIRRVSESLGSVDIARKPTAKVNQDTYPLTDKAKALYLNVAISSGKKYSELTAVEVTALGNKGVVFAGQFSGFDGFYINNGHVAGDITATYAFIEDNRVWCKAATLVRLVTIPTIRGNFPRNADQSMRSTYKSYLKEKILGALSGMIKGNELSATPEIEVNETETGSGSVSLGLKYVQEGVQRELNGVIGPF